jgi:hypothetical protein
MPELEATASPIPFWFYRVVAGAAEPWGQLRRRRACNNTVRGGTAPLALDEFGRCVICVRRGFFAPNA